MAKLSPFPTGQELDDNGNPLAGGTVDFYEAGTLTRKAAYSSQDESVVLANPATFDSAGRLEIWLGEGAYYIIVKDSAGNLIDERDNIVGDLSTSFLGSTFEVSTNTIINASYQNSYVAVTGTTILTLLTATSAGVGFSFVVQNTGSGTVTIDPDGSETIDGSPTLVLSPTEWAVLTCDGANWNALVYKTGLKVSNNDTTFGFLGDKLAAGDGIDLTVNNDGANETLTIAAEGTLAQYDLIQSDTFTGATDINVNSAEDTKAYIDNTPRIGEGQTWTDVSGSRALDTIYTNSTGRAIQVVATINFLTGSQARFYIDGDLVSSNVTGSGTSNKTPFSFIIPNGSTYEVEGFSGTVTISQWVELR